MHLLSKNFLDFARHFLDFLFPKLCLGCSCEGFLICEICLLSLTLSSRWPKNSFEIRYFERCFSVFEPTPLLRQSIHALKYHFLEEVSVLLGDFVRRRVFLADFSASVDRDFLVVPVPLHWRRLYDRGFNQSELLVHAAGFVPTHLLRRRRRTRAQALLTREERLTNLVDAFVIDADVLHSVRTSTASDARRPFSKLPPVLLVDDVCTTGATLMECAKVLRAAGFEKIFSLVLAHGL
jgi:ComF family protein